MKKIKKCIVPVLLICSMLFGTVNGNYRQVQAAEVVAGMETIQFIISLAASAGFTIGIVDLLGKSRDEVKDWDSYDWGNLLDDPASQKQIDDTEKQIEDYYNNAVKDWYVKHGGQLSPSPAPTTTPQPPVTVAPIDPDTVEPPIDWDTLKKKTEETGILSMVGATLACMREGLAKFWDDVVSPVKINEDLPDDVKEIIKSRGYPCYMYTVFNQGKSDEHRYLYLGASDSFYYDNRVDFNGSVIEFRNGKFVKNYNNMSKGFETSNYNTNIKKLNSYKDGLAWREEQKNKKKIPKAAIIPDLDRKQPYDNNASIGDSTSSGTGSSPGSDTDNPFNFKVPTIDEIKDFLKDLMGGDEDDQPSKVTNFITNHVVEPSTDPEPDPTTAPSPGGGESGGGSTKPDNPDPSEDTGIDDYKTDLRLVFPFCIPFDLIHLLNAFDAEPEAPVFEFPLDIDLNNPFSGGKVVDYHHVFTLDMSDYESVVEILRIFQVIFFIIALMMITRQQMIKG